MWWVPPDCTIIFFIICFAVFSGSGKPLLFFLSVKKHCTLQFYRRTILIIELQQIILLLLLLFFLSSVFRIFLVLNREPVGYCSYHKLNVMLFTKVTTGHAVICG